MDPQLETCPTGKMIYLTATNAAKQARQMKKYKRGRFQSVPGQAHGPARTLAPYRCRFCHGWHLRHSGTIQSQRRKVS